MLLTLHSPSDRIPSSVRLYARSVGAGPGALRCIPCELAQARNQSRRALMSCTDCKPTDCTPSGAATHWDSRVFLVALAGFKRCAAPSTSASLAACSVARFFMFVTLKIVTSKERTEREGSE